MLVFLGCFWLFLLLIFIFLLILIFFIAFIFLLVFLFTLVFLLILILLGIFVFLGILVFLILFLFLWGFCFLNLLLEGSQSSLRRGLGSIHCLVNQLQPVYSVLLESRLTLLFELLLFGLPQLLLCNQQGLQSLELLYLRFSQFCYELFGLILLCSEDWVLRGSG